MPSYQVRGVTNIAFPVLNQHGNAIAALSVPFLARIGDRIGPADVKSVLLEASERLSSAVGGKTT
jgi:DNA-binding IclR family transcriptional regulator